MDVEPLVVGVCFLLVGLFAIVKPMRSMVSSGTDLEEAPGSAKEKQVLRAWFFGISLVGIGLVFLAVGFTG